MNQTPERINMGTCTFINRPTPTPTVTVPPSGFSVQFQTVLRQASPFSSSASNAEAPSTPHYTVAMPKDRIAVKDYRVIKLARRKWAVEVFQTRQWKQPTDKLFRTSTKAYNWLSIRFTIPV